MFIMPKLEIVTLSVFAYIVKLLSTFTNLSANILLRNCYITFWVKVNGFKNKCKTALSISKYSTKNRLSFDWNKPCEKTIKWQIQMVFKPTTHNIILQFLRTG